MYEMNQYYLIVREDREESKVLFDSIDSVDSVDGVEDVEDIEDVEGASGSGDVSGDGSNGGEGNGNSNKSGDDSYISTIDFNAYDMEKLGELYDTEEPNVDSLGNFGPLFFWVQFETGCTDINAYDVVTLNDGVGGQAYGLQFDLMQGSLKDFISYAFASDPTKWYMFKDLIMKSTKQLYAYSQNDALPKAWHLAYSTDPEGWKSIQLEYLKKFTIAPTREVAEKAGIDFTDRCDTVLGAMVSWTHQHGLITVEHIKEAGITNNDSDEAIIMKLYARRTEWRGHWGGLNLWKRYESEESVALELLAEEKSFRTNWENYKELKEEYERYQRRERMKESLKNEASGSTFDMFVGLGVEGHHLTMVWPVPSCNENSSAYGWRLHPIYGTMRFHNGEDIPADSGTPIVAALDGTVIFTDPESSGSGYGNYTVIDHGNHIYTAYAHQLLFNVKVGDKVKAGDVIGYVGSTGGSTGPHLHFEVYTPWAVNNGSYICWLLEKYGDPERSIDPKTCEYIYM